MNRKNTFFAKSILAAGALLAVTAPAMARDWHHDRDRYDRRYADDYDVRLRGPGVDDLNPWFRNAKAGRLYVVNRAGTYVSAREAWMLNREYDRQHYGDDRGWRDRDDRGWRDRDDRW